MAVVRWRTRMDTEDKVFIAIALLVALSAHAFIRSFWVACIVIVFASRVLYAVESFIRLQLPPAKIFWLPLVFLEGGFLAFGLAALSSYGSAGSFGAGYRYRAAPEDPQHFAL